MKLEMNIPKMKLCSAIKKILFVLLFILDEVKQNFIFRVRGPLVGGGIRDHCRQDGPKGEKPSGRGRSETTRYKI